VDAVSGLITVGPGHQLEESAGGVLAQQLNR